MQLVRTTTQPARVIQPSVAMIGNFDGVHLAHQAIIKYAIALSKANDLQSVLVNFEPTPKEHFLGAHAPARIYTFREKFEIIKSMGVERFICLRFNETFAKMGAEDFVKDILLDSLRIKHLIVGDDFRFGHGRKGDTAMLQAMGEQHGYQVHDQDTLLHAATRVSSSFIREQLAAGEFELAHTLLGRRYNISGRVVRGEQRGRTIGFPTANILLKRKNSPLRGVFVIRVRNEKQSWNGVANIGRRPTVNGEKMQLEAHLFNCNENLYGQRLHVEPLHKLRDEIKFPSFSELQKQITIDAQQAKNYFNERI
jgi:riboflavin kinase/FMN adenylyltransferase